MGEFLEVALFTRRIHDIFLICRVGVFYPCMRENERAICVIEVHQYTSCTFLSRVLAIAVVPDCPGVNEIWHSCIIMVNSRHNMGNHSSAS